MRDGEVDANAHQESAQSRTPKPPHGRHPHNGMGGGTVMTPESSEGRERIARLESQVEDVERQVARNERTFGPLVLGVERLQWTIDAMNTRMDKRDREDEERFEKLSRSFENQITHCSNEVAKVAEQQEAWQIAERERRENEKRAEREDSATDKTSRRAMWGLIGAAAVAGVLGLLTQLITLLS